MANLTKKTAIPPELAGKAEPIPITRILSLKKEGKTDLEIGELLGCSHQNISKRLKEWRNELQGLEKFKENRADVFALLQSKIINTLSPEDIKKTSASQRITMAAILYDKERLERGQSTANIDNHSRIDVLTGKLEDIAKLQIRLSKRKVTRS